MECKFSNTLSVFVKNLIACQEYFCYFKMQLYALDRSSKIISAKNAHKKEVYFCLECGSPLYCRGGFYKQNHFYHIKANRTCRQNGKSEEHLQVQLFLQEALGEKECLLEKPFKEINRIADVVWPSKKLVFEVQCSPILASEVKKRNEDYESLGFFVIWILHDKRFNQKRLSAAENYLQIMPYYFTNINKQGNGIIYDSFWLMEKGMRIFSTPFFAVSISLASHVEVLHQKLKERKKEIPDLLWKKIESQKYCFEGDLTEQLLNGKTSELLFEEALKRQKKKEVKWSLRFLFQKLIVRPYKIIFNILLEKACL